jgi:hypothetical protein
MMIMGLWGDLAPCLGVCPNIRDHQLRREFDSIKAAKRSRTLRHHSGNDQQ